MIIKALSIAWFVFCLVGCMGQQPAENSRSALLAKYRQEVGDLGVSQQKANLVITEYEASELTEEQWELFVDPLLND